EKKIAELEAVEHWLKANTSMLQLTIKSLQYQRAMLKGGEKFQQEIAPALKPTGAGPGDAADAESQQPPNPALSAWNMMAQAGKPSPARFRPETAAQPGPKKKSKKKP